VLNGTGVGRSGNYVRCIKDWLQTGSRNIGIGEAWFAPDRVCKVQYARRSA
jgi:hypothetical protein